jgi:hypothetical protein
MFRQNEEHRQQSLFNAENLLPQKPLARLRGSWAATFYRELSCRVSLMRRSLTRSLAKRLRGLIRAQMTLYPAVLMVNLRRLHRHFEEKAEEATEEIASFFILARASALLRLEVRLSPLLDSLKYATRSVRC